MMNNPQPEYGSPEWKERLSQKLWQNQEVYELSLMCSKAELGRVMQIMVWMDIRIEGSCSIYRRPDFTLEQMRGASGFFLVRMHPAWVEEFKTLAKLKEWQLRPATVAVLS